MMKDFTTWNALKTQLNDRSDAPRFDERDVWWCSIGANVGDEEDGKSHLFSRPVLVVRKFNAHLFWGVPLTTQIKQTPHYHLIHFKNREQCVMLSHLKSLESRRMIEKMGKLNEGDFKAVKDVIKNML
jgi:mRNA interferase MazF